MLLHLPGGGLLMDCGEGTLGQMIRSFGPGRAALQVRTILGFGHKGLNPRLDTLSQMIRSFGPARLRCR